MHLEAVTVCVGYADFLAAVAPWNRPHFEKWVVVTSKNDHETLEVCRQYHITAVVTDDDKRDGPFSKGRLVERGLQHLSAEAWVLHVDGDVCLPNAVHDALDAAHLRDDGIYGCDRFMVRDYAAWTKLLQRGWPSMPKRDHPHSVAPPFGFSLGSRWCGQDGYVPIGFFQLWHRKGGGEEWRGARMKPYPVAHGTACRTDVQHGLQWDRRHRHLIPELFVAHLESGDSTPQRGANWKGRTTPRFGPPVKGKGCDGEHS